MLILGADVCLKSTLEKWIEEEKDGLFFITRWSELCREAHIDELEALKNVSKKSDSVRSRLAGLHILLMIVRKVTSKYGEFKVGEKYKESMECKIPSSVRSKGVVRQWLDALYMDLVNAMLDVAFMDAYPEVEYPVRDMFKSMYKSMWLAAVVLKYEDDALVDMVLQTEHEMEESFSALSEKLSDLESGVEDAKNECREDTM